MHGDFSTRFGTGDVNLAGVLHQQGRVSLDADGNAVTSIATDWQDTEARDLIGSGVAAIPAEVPDSFKVEAAVLDAVGKTVTITLDPGRAWVDGILVRLETPPPSDPPIKRYATYLQPPVQDSPGTLATTLGSMDAVVLEVWRESLSAFQRPELLMEPALGGPDTTERLHTSFDLRLYRMGPGDDCAGLAGLLGDQTDQRGHLSVTLTPSVMIPGDCPVFEGGGYTGFEHNLYRIEIADVDTGGPMFKWSRFNGGLVGRADFAGTTASLTANLQAIVTSGRTDFYLEALEPELDPNTGLATVFDRWRVVYGAPVVLNNDDELLLGLTAFGTVPAGVRFIRLWDDIRPTSDFKTGLVNPTELVDGICLAFEADATGKYTPGDYWTFPVRAGGIPPLVPLIDNQPPEGVRCHRVPLAILDWTSTSLTVADGSISDCREVFHPRTRRDSCCTVRVGDGIHSHGDFTSIQAAINSIAGTGGKVCVLPGTYWENIRIDKLHDIVVSGCGPRSRVISPAPDPQAGPADPVFWISRSQSITIEHLRIDADPSGIGVLIDDSAPPVVIEIMAAAVGKLVLTRNILLRGLSIGAARQCAIDVRVGSVIAIRDCATTMADVATSRHAISFVAEDGVIERNVVRVESKPSIAITEGTRLLAIAGLGGIQLGGRCKRVHVLDNIVQSGIGHGITLGSLRIVDDNGGDTGGGDDDPGDPCTPCKPGDGYIPPTGGKGTHILSAGPLTDIYIERNRIWDMGLDGIGVVGFWDLNGVDEMISVERLTIVRNEIYSCLQRQLFVRRDMLTQMGYGGIALADVEYLVIRENVIENNGPDFTQPVCGIFVLHGEGIDITDNRIRNNGAKTEDLKAVAKDGERGGIVIVFAIAPAIPTDVTFLGISLPGAPVQNGVPALRVHDNIVSTPVGQALSAVALGPVSVHANSLTTHGIALPRTGSSPGRIAAAVSIVNLGLSNEIYLQLLAFAALASLVLGPSGAVETDDAIIIPAAGLDDLGIGRLLADGTVQFTDNQIVLDLLQAGTSVTLSSILIASLDDIAFADNQCTSNLAADIVFIQAIVLGYTMRVEANRFTESALFVLLSALTYGFANMTTHNQATHCIIAGASTSLLANTPNHIRFQTGLCKQAANIHNTLHV